MSDSAFSSSLLPVSPSGHQLGVLGHIKVSDDLQRTAENFGGRIVRLADFYLFEINEGQGAFNYSGDFTGLKNHLLSLKQPVYTGIRNAILAEEGAGKSNSKQIKKRIDAERKIVHAVLRHVTTGSPFIPRYVHPHLLKEEAACHSQYEEKVRTDDMWASTCEIDLKNRIVHYDPQFEKNPLEPAIIPGSNFDPVQGFSFKVKKSTVTPAAHDNQVDPLQAWFKRTVEKVTQGRSPQGAAADTIYFSASEMQDFVSQAHQDIATLTLMVEAAAFKECKDEITARVMKTAQSLRSYPDFHALERGVAHEDPYKKLKRLSKCTSALSPIVASDAMRERWVHYFFTQRHEAPMEKIMQDIRMFETIAQELGGIDNLSHAHLEAMAIDPAFAPTIGFARATCASFHHVLENTDPQTLDARHTDLMETLAAAEEIFRESSLTGLHPKGEHMSEDYSAVVDLIERSIGQGPGAGEHILKTLGGNYVEFMKDIYTYPFRGVREFSSTAATVGLLYWWMNGGAAVAREALPSWIINKSQMAVSAAPVAAAVGGGTGVMPGMDGAVDTAFQNAYNFKVRDMVTPDDLGGIEGIDWHRHPSLESAVGYVRHYFNELVIGTAKTYISGFDEKMSYLAQSAGFPLKEKSEYLTGAYAAAVHMKFLTWTANLLQNYYGHSLYFGSMGAKGGQHGLRGLPHIFSFFHTFHDAGRAMLFDKPLALPAGLYGLYVDQIQPRLSGGDMGTTGAAHLMGYAAAGYMISPLLQYLPGPFNKKHKSPLALVKKFTGNAQNMMRDAVNEDICVHMTADHDGLAQAMAEAGEIYTALESTLPENIREAAIRMRYRPLQAQGFNILRRLDNGARALRIKNTGLNDSFRISSHNYKPVMRALTQMNVMMTVAAEHLGAESVVYQNFLKGKLQAVVEGMRAYQKKEIDEPQLREVLDAHLRDVVAAQVHMTGSSPVYEALFEHALKPQDAQRLEWFGAHAMGHQGRIEKAGAAQKELNEALIELRGIRARQDYLHSGIFPDLYARAAQQLKATKASAKVSGWSAWDMIVDGLRATQHATGNIPHKKKMAVALAVAGMMATGWEKTGSEDALINQVSHLNGQLHLITAASGVFLVVNGVEDQVVVHMGWGAGFMATGTIAIFWPGKFVVKPLKNYLEELTREGRYHLKDKILTAWKEMNKTKVQKSEPCEQPRPSVGVASITPEDDSPPEEPPAATAVSEPVFK